MTEIKDEIKDTKLAKKTCQILIIKSYSSLQTKCYKFSRQQDTEEIELVSKVRKVCFDQGISKSDRCNKIDGMDFSEKWRCRAC